jgi:hypothetical protein
LTTADYAAVEYDCYEPSVEELEELGAFDDYSDEELDAAEDSLVEYQIGEWKLQRNNVKTHLGSAWVEYEAAKHGAWANGVRVLPREYREAEAAIEWATDASFRDGYAWLRELGGDEAAPKNADDDFRAALQAAGAAIRAAIPALQRARQLATRAASVRACSLIPLASRRTRTRARESRPQTRRVARARTSTARGDPDDPEPARGRRPDEHGDRELDPLRRASA